MRSESVTGTRLADVLDRPPSGRDVACFVDGVDYARTVLAGGRAIGPDDPGALADLVRRMCGLTGTDALVLDVAAVVAESVTEPGTAASGARALRRTLDDPAVRSGVVAVADVYAAAVADRPIVLRVPAVADWVDTLTGTSLHEDERAEVSRRGAPYVADLLRELSGTPVAALVLTGPPGDELAPLRNVCDAYGWGLIHATQPASFDPGLGGVGPDRVVDLVPAGEWPSDRAPLRPGDLALVTVAHDADPDVVQARLALTGGERR